MPRRGDRSRPLGRRSRSWPSGWPSTASARGPSPLARCGEGPGRGPARGDPGLGQAARAGRRGGLRRAGPAHRRRLDRRLPLAGGLRQRRSADRLAAAGAARARCTPIRGWLYLKDEWAKRHPIFDGLPAGGLMDYTYYREIIPDVVWHGQDPPAEAVAGAIKASQDYASGLMVSVYRWARAASCSTRCGSARTWARHPAAERLLRNMLRYAARTRQAAGRPAGRFRPATPSHGPGHAVTPDRREARLFRKSRASCQPKTPQ